MNQIQKKQYEFDALEELEDAIEKAKLDLQKSISLVILNVNVEEAFEGTLSTMSDIEAIARRIISDDLMSVASEKILLYSMHFDETIKQLQVAGTTLNNLEALYEKHS